MHYAVIHKEQVLVGPKDWNRSFFVAMLNRVNIKNVMIPRFPTDIVFPYIIDENTKIVKVTIVEDNYDQDTQYLRGPLWDFSGADAIARYEAVDTPLEFIKERLKKSVAHVRYEKEVAGTTATIQTITVTLDTSREGRNIFIQKLLLMKDDETINWKFPEGWLTISKSDLALIVESGASYIQSTFDWEKTLNDKIDTAATKEELLSIQIKE